MITMATMISSMLQPCDSVQSRAERYRLASALIIVGRVTPLFARSREVTSGVSVMAMRSEASSAMEMVVPISRVKICTSPLSMNKRGIKTMMVVRVDAVMASETSVAPREAASFFGNPFSCRRNMFSTTTMELSTSIPMARMSPSIEIMFSPIPMK